MRKFILLFSILLLPFLVSAEGWEFQKPPLGVQVDWSNPITKGLERCWLFNENGGSPKEFITCKYLSRLVGTTYPWKTTLKGVAFRAEEEDEWKGAVIGRNVFTVSFLVETSRIDYTAYVANIRNSANNANYGFNFNTAERIKVSSWNGAVGKDIASTTVVSVNTFYSVSIMVNGALSKLYVNGLFEASGELHTHISGPDIHFAANLGAYPLKGSIVYFYIHNRILTSQEVQQLHINPYGMFKRMEVSLIKALEVAAGWSHKWNGLSGINWNGVPNANISKINGI